MGLSYSLLFFFRVCVFLCVYYYCCVGIYLGIIFLRGAYVTIIISGIFILLSRVDVVFCFVHYFRYFPVYKLSLVYFILKAILLVVISCTPPVDRTFLIYAFLLVVFWVVVSGIPPFSNLFLLTFSF